MFNHGYTTVAERRKSTRFAKDRDTDSAVIWHTEGDKRLVEVHDDSLGGLSVYLKDVGGFDVGQKVGVVYKDSMMHAFVRHIELQPSGEFIVGLECVRVD